MDTQRTLSCFQHILPYSFHYYILIHRGPFGMVQTLPYFDVAPRLSRRAPPG